MESLRTISPDESRVADAMTSVLIKSIGHTSKRAMHDNIYFVASGVLEIAMTEETPKGFFSEHRTVPCKLRFTSATSPGNKEVIGCGLFLFDEDEQTYLSMAFDSFERFWVGRTQDIDDIAWCLSLTRFLLLNVLILFFVFLFKCKVWRLFAMKNTLKDHSSVFSPTYHTCGAFRWGDQGAYAKFSLDPYSYTTIQCPRKDFSAEAKLRLALHSNKGYAAFYLNAQIKPAGDTTLDIEGADQAWTNVIKSRVGKITIHSIENSTDWGVTDNAFLMNDKYLENHAPVGSFNRVRWAVYKNVVQYRTQLMA